MKDRLPRKRIAEMPVLIYTGTISVTITDALRLAFEILLQLLLYLIALDEYRKYLICIGWIKEPLLLPKHAESLL